MAQTRLERLLGQQQRIFIKYLILSLGTTVLPIIGRTFSKATFAQIWNKIIKKVDLKHKVSFNFNLLSKKKA